MPSWAAILVSITFVLLFGEILPSAFFVGPNQLQLASHLAPLMQFFLRIFVPFNVPLGRLFDFDKIVGTEAGAMEETHNQSELSALV